MGYVLAKKVATTSHHRKYLRARLREVLLLVALGAVDRVQTGPAYTLPVGFYGMGADWLIRATGRDPTPSNRSHMYAEITELVEWGLLTRCDDPRPDHKNRGIRLNVEKL